MAEEVSWDTPMLNRMNVKSVLHDHIQTSPHSFTTNSNVLFDPWLFLNNLVSVGILNTDKYYCISIPSQDPLCGSTMLRTVFCFAPNRDEHFEPSRPQETQICFSLYKVRFLLLLSCSCTCFFIFQSFY